jgi:HK97 family phage major capsid protein
MKTSKFYTEERSSVVENMEAIIDTAKVEGRELTESETTEFDSLNEKANSLESMAKRAASFESLQASKASKSNEVTEENTPKEMRDYSFQDAMKAAYTGNLNGLVKEMDQEARNQARYTGQMYKGIAVPSAVLEARAVTTSASNSVEAMSFTDQLEANLVLASAGANFYSGVNNMKFPVISGISTTFVAETGGSVSAAGSTSSLTLSPQKCISIVEVSAEAMTQNAGIEAALRRNMAASVAAQLEKNLLSSADNSDGGPQSILADAADGGATLDAAAILAMESTVLGNNVPLLGGRFAYLCNADALAIIKTLVQASGVEAIYDNRDKTINSYFSFVSSNVGFKSSSNFDNVLFGDFSRVHIAQFGGLDLLFDPYTSAASGVGRMIATSLVDGNAVDNGTAFVEIQTTS